MSKSDFADNIISKLSGAIGTDGSKFTENSASSAMSAVATGITEYLIANTKVTVAYNGIIPGTPPTPDPLVEDTFEIIGAVAPTGPSSSFDDWISKIEANIISGFALAPSGENGLVFAQTPFLSTGIATSQSDLKSAHDIDDENPQKKIWEIVCGDIMDWINSGALNPAVGAATHPTASSAGTANIVSISIS